MAAALVAAPAVAFADQQAQPAAAQAQEQQAAPAQANTDAGDNSAEVAENGVAKVGDKAYSTVQDAVNAAKAGDTVTLVKDTADNVTVNKKLTFQREGEVTFSGTLTFNKGSEGSIVDGLAFESDGTHDGVIVHGVDASNDNIVIKGSSFSTPSAVLADKGADKDGKDTDWQPSSVVVRYSKGVKVTGNTFNLGRISEKTADGKGVEADSDVAINTYGQTNDGLIIDGNTLTVTKPADGVTDDSSVDLLIAMGWADRKADPNAYGINNVTVSNNTFDGSADAKNPSTRLAGLSQVKNITFTGNKVKNAARGIAQSVWQGAQSENALVKLGEGNIFTNVASPFEAATVQNESSNENIGATVLKADGELVGYNWIQDAVKAVNDGGDEFKGATITLQKSVDNHSKYTLNKQVTFTSAPGRNYTFNGQLRLNASDTKVTGMHLVLDGVDLTFEGKAYKSGLLQSVILSNHAEGIEISGNTFDLPSLDKGDVDFQLSSVWLEQGVKGSKITGNVFNLGRAYNNSSVGINFVGAAKTVIRDTTLSNNKVTFTKDAFDDSNIVDDKGNVVGSGSVFFAVANGNRQGESPAAYGIEGVTAEGNVIDGSATPRRDYGIAISNVKGADFTGNAITGTYMAVSYSGWQGQAPSSTGLTFKKNDLKDNTAAVYFKPQFEAGTMTPADITYGGGDETNTVEVSKYAKSDPYVFGLAFAGWYDAQGNVATDKNAPAYGKLVPISDVIKQLGGSLNMENKSTDFKTTDLRLGYGVVTPNATHKIDKWSWKVSYANPNGEKKSLTVNGVNSRKPRANEIPRVGADATVTNVLLTQLSTEWYRVDFTSVMTVEYTTDDGTKVTQMDSPFLTRSVKGVAEKITSKDSQATEEEKAYAEGVLNVIKDQQ